jgi:hypothetical protein
MLGQNASVTFDEAQTANTNGTYVSNGVQLENDAEDELTFGVGRAEEPFSF